MYPLPALDRSGPSGYSSIYVEVSHCCRAVHSPRRDASGTRTTEEGGEPDVGEKNKCRVIIKRAGGEECTLPVENCCDEPGGEHVIVVRCDSTAADCCCKKED